MIPSMTNAQIESVKKHFIECYPEEGVAILLKSGLIHFPDNIHESPQNYFRICPIQYNELSKSVAGLLHSHPDVNQVTGIDLRTPSPNDCTNQIMLDVPWGIMSVTEDLVCSELLWFPVSPDEPLYERQFIHGVTDCFSFIQAYYWQTKGVLIPRTAGHNWANPLDNSLAQAILDCPLVEEIPIEDMVEGTLLAIADSTGHVCHFMINIGKGKVAHQAVGKYSCIEPIRKYRKFIARCYHVKN
jgi:proteasome lid subunit RPN8/RPN11